jgi:polar amino acid transport system substrate-binding protein
LTTVDFPPFNFIDQTGKLAGFHVDLVREVCRELALTDKCQIQAVTFPELEKALVDGNGEAVAAGIAVTTDLRKRFVFSRPFMRLPARFAVAKKTPPSGEAAAAALDGKRVGVVAASAHEAMLKAYFPRLQAEAFPDRTALLAALKDGKVDAVFADGMQLAFWTNGTESAGCCRLFDGPYVSEEFLGEGLTIMLRKEDKALLGAIDHALLALSRNGRLQEIYLRYFPVNLYGG